MSRFWLVPLVLAVAVILPFLVWGEDLGALLQVDPQTGRFGDTGVHGGLVGMGLLVADLFAPIPTSAVMAGLGVLYGPVVGGAYALAGAMLAALCGYGLGRGLGRPLAARWLGGQLATGERAFAAHGGWIVAASRWMPVLPEVVSVSAGVARMPLPAFAAAALCGAAPHAALFAVIGWLGAEAPVWTIAISALAPVLLWLIAVRLGWARRLGLTS